MHGLIIRSIQNFVRDTYGASVWTAVSDAVSSGGTHWECMLSYDPDVTARLVAGLCTRLGKPREMVLQNLGIYLVSHPNVEVVRRLLRFGGVCYEDFLVSLEDMPDRVRLAVPELQLPELTVRQTGPVDFTLTCGPGMPGFCNVLRGMLTAMADDYGVLAMLDGPGGPDGGGDVAETLHIRLHDSRYASGRSFELTRRTA